MRQIFLEKGALAIKEVCEPSLDEYSVLISVSYSYMSVGSGLAAILDANQHLFFKNIPSKVKKIVELASQKGIDYTTSFIKDKLEDRTLVFGHSCSGTVLAIGAKVKAFRVGDLVACAGPGLANHADVVCVTEHLVAHIKNEKYIKTASLVGHGTMALQSIRRASLQLGESIVIFGLDSFGQIAMRLAKINGAKVIGIDAIQERLAYSQQAGFNHVYSFERDNIEHVINGMTAHKGVDCVIISPDCADETILEKAAKIVRRKGRIIIAGNKKFALQQHDAYQKEVDILFSLSYGPGRHDPSYEYQGHDYPYSFVRWTENRNMEFFVHLIESEQIELNDLVASEIPAEQIDTCVKEIKKKKLVGLIVDFTKNKKDHQQASAIKIIPAQVAHCKDEISIGIIGIGRFAKNTLWPIVKNMRNVTIDTVLDEDIAKVMRAKKIFKKSTVCVGSAITLLRSTCNVVFISPSIDISVDDVIALLDAGKAVFVAHALAFNQEDLDKLQHYLDTHPSALFCIGYHRRFSPLIIKIKAAVQHRNTPLMITYRLNTSSADEQEKIHTQWKHGKMIAQGSHIFDLFNFIIDAKPMSISVDSVKAASHDIYQADNFACQLTYNDGSIATLLLTSIASAESGIERMEIFFDAKTIVMEDYMLLKGYNVSADFSERLPIADNGYEQLIINFIGLLKGENKKLQLKELDVACAKLSFMADKMIFKDV